MIISSFPLFQNKTKPYFQRWSGIFCYHNTDWWWQDAAHCFEGTRSWLKVDTREFVALTCFSWKSVFGGLDVKEFVIITCFWKIWACRYRWSGIVWGPFEEKINFASGQQFPLFFRTGLPRWNCNRTEFDDSGSKVLERCQRLSGLLFPHLVRWFALVCTIYTIYYTIDILYTILYTILHAYM